MAWSPNALGRAQRGLWAIAALLCVVATVRATLFADDIPFVTGGDGSPWITAPYRTTADLIAVRPEAPPAFDFVRRFDGAEPGTPASLRGRALRQVEIELNGRSVPIHGDGTEWKRGFEADLTDLLRPERNELRVRVRNVHGPPLLQLTLQVGEARLTTGTDWQVSSVGLNPRPAPLAADSIVHPESRSLAPTWAVAADLGPGLLVVFGVCAALAFGAHRAAPPRLAHRLPEYLLGLIVGLWGILFFTKGLRMPVALGFDAHAHLAYIAYLIEDWTPPTADYGFSTYHPPAFHGLAALLVGPTGVSPEPGFGAFVYRLIPLGAGLTTVFCTHRVARRLWPAEALRPALAVAVVGLLPMNLYMSTYVSNEALHATWISVALCVAVEGLMAAQLSPRRIAALGGVLGLGLLTKFTSLALAPVIAGFAAVRLWVVDDRGPARAAAVGAAMLAVAFAIAGWFYVRNWILFDDPFVWNLNVPGAATWWMLPGFRSVDSYLSFGESLRYPFFAGFSSVGDGIYSTLWGDGLVAGMVRVETRHPYWNYAFMTLIGPLAVPLTALILFGFVRQVLESLRGSDLGRRLSLGLLTTVLFVLAFSLFFITLRLPFYAQAKAPYMLAATLPLSLCAAEGLAWLPRRYGGSPRGMWILTPYFAWLGTLAIVIAVAFLG